MTLSAIVVRLAPAEARDGAQQDQQGDGDDADADDAPQGRGGDGDAEVGRRRFAAAVGAERGDIVAGDRLVGRLWSRARSVPGRSLAASRAARPWHLPTPP